MCATTCCYHSTNKGFYIILYSCLLLNLLEKNFSLQSNFVRKNNLCWIKKNLFEKQFLLDKIHLSEKTKICQKKIFFEKKFCQKKNFVKKNFLEKHFC